MGQTDRIVALLRQCARNQIGRLGGSSLATIINPGLPEADIQRYERGIRAQLPSEFRAFIRYSNGATLYGAVLQSVAAETARDDPYAWMDVQRLLPEARLLTIHAWGLERDVDCIALKGSRFPEGSIVFVNGDSSRCVCYQPSFADWLEMAAVGAMRDRGVLHPREYVKYGLPLDECVAGEVVRVAVEKGWDIFSVPGDKVNDPAQLRALAERAVVEQPRALEPAMLDGFPVPRTRMPDLPRQPKHVPSRQNETADLLRTWEGVRLRDEDGDIYTIRLRDGVSPERLAALERAVGHPLPSEYIDFMVTTDGLELLLHEILDLGRQGVIKEHRLITLQNWGNGDFDCLALEGSRFPAGSIVFCNHNPGVAVKVADSITDWLRRLMEEIKATGGIYHPRDYWVPRDYKGVYSHVCDELDDVDCELNR
ncbi:MAG: SMI1/KNR4 family protein [Phycisphaerales bacterium]|nr:SMI1/KNR4 family protein [Phycisphaerales bacterium]